MRQISLLIIFTLLLFFLTGKAYQTSALSFHFVDEEDNIVLGNYLLKGEKLYSDLFSHHQPLAYILSAGVSQVSDPNTIFLLIKRHREAMIAWSILWGILLVLRFRLIGFLTLSIYEPLKIFLLGHLFLSESLVVYPLVYLLSWVFLAKRVIKWETVFLGICFGISFLLLSPLWPLLGILAVLVLGRLGRLGKLGLLGGGIIPLLVVINFISIPDYLFNAFYINFQYYIPMTSKEPIYLTSLKALISPVLTFFNPANNNATMQIARALSAALLVNIFILLKKGNWKFPLLAIILLGLSNMRFVPPGEESYSGFHIIPWFMALIITSVVSIKMVGIRLVPGILLIILAVTVVRESGQTLFQRRDMDKDYYINYSRQADFGEAVKIMKDESDTLFVVPDEWLIYWQADIAQAFWMVNYYAWMSEVREIKDPLHEKFAKNPPTFFYCDRCQLGYFGLEQFFPQYQKVVKDGKGTSLMVLKTKLTTLTNEQKEKLRFYGFVVE